MEEFCVWDKKFIKDEVIISGDRWVWIKGYIQEIQREGTLDVVYGYHDISKKRKLW